jgi:hypothetical protein
VSSYSTTVTVLNAPPIVGDIDNDTIDEGSLFTTSGSFTDPGPDTWTANVDYGDGTGTQPLTITGMTFALNHTYDSHGTFFVTVEVTDDDGASDSETFIVSVLNVSPQTGIDLALTVAEGDLYSGSGSFVDPGANSWNATVNYGDGSGVSALALSAGKSFELGHVYADNASYTIVVCVIDDGGGYGCSSVILDVTNSSPEVEAGANQVIDEGDLLTLDPSSFHDQGTADSHTATINWGDGSTTDAGVVTESPFGPPGSIFGTDGAISGSHVYIDNGTYTATICVTDDDLAQACDNITVDVGNIAPTVDAGPDISIVQGQEFAIVAGFTDPGAIDTHSATINWGDSTSDVLVVVESDGSGTASASHQFVDAGFFNVTVCVLDNDGDNACDTMVIEAISAAEATERFAEFLAGLDIPAGTASSLGGKLDNAIESFELGEYQDGINQLGSFINQVEAQSGKKISTEDAEALIVMANHIIEGALNQEGTKLPGSNGNGGSGSGGSGKNK